MNAPLRVLIAVTHLLGIGHLQRMIALARATQRAGHLTLLVSGGHPNPATDLAGLDVRQLPPVGCRDADFSTLYDQKGEVASKDLLAERAGLMAKAVRDFRPDVVVSELYPFGRRNLEAEFEALLVAAQGLAPRPAILASIRDVLNPPAKAGRPASVLARLARAYDAVLVHGDEAIIPLEASWQVGPALGRKLIYTGYLFGDGRARAEATEQRRGIIVSGGGSAAGMQLYRAALVAARLVPWHGWQILVGHGVPAAEFVELQDSCPANACIERARPDFVDLLSRAVLSISQAGYNTILDLAAAGPRALLVPFAEGQEREQTIRAEALATRGLCTVLDARDLDGERLAAAAEQCLAAPAPDWSAIRPDGAGRAVAAIVGAAEKAARRASAWRRLDATLRKAEQSARTIPVWIRDDDAVASTPELDRFLALLDRWRLPVGIAAIPGMTGMSLVERCRSRPGTDLLVHGLAHLNHAPGDAKKAEFGAHRPIGAMLAELEMAKSRLAALAGDLVLPVLVPPWNRIAPDIVAALPGLGFRGISTFADPKPGDTPAGLVRANTHWDPIDWREGGGLGDEASLIESLTRLIAMRSAPVSGRALEPIGLLTHHLVHDGWVDRFLEEVLGRLAASPAIRFLSARAVFAEEVP